MPAWPYGFEGRAEDRLDGGALENVVFSHEWMGRGKNGEVFLRRTAADGRTTHRTAKEHLTGTVTVEDDRYCQKFPAVLLGRKYCGYVYRNPEGTPDHGDAYVDVDVFDLLSFGLTD